MLSVTAGVRFAAPTQRVTTPRGHLFCLLAGRMDALCRKRSLTGSTDRPPSTPAGSCPGSRSRPGSGRHAQAKTPGHRPKPRIYEAMELVVAPLDAALRHWETVQANAAARPWFPARGASASISTAVRPRPPGITLEQYGNSVLGQYCPSWLVVPPGKSIPRITWEIAKNPLDVFGRSWLLCNVRTNIPPARKTPCTPVT